MTQCTKPVAFEYGEYLMRDKKIISVCSVVQLALL